MILNIKMTESFVPSLEQIKEIQSSGIPETTKKNYYFLGERFA